MTNHFADRLCNAVKDKKTPLIVGLDPVYDRLPETIKNNHSTSADSSQGKTDLTTAVDAIFEFSIRTLRVVAPLVAAVKMNIAFFERYLWQGTKTYYSLITEAKQLGLEVIGDVKRGDIGHTAQAYADAHLGSPEFSTLQDVITPDAITINGFAGSDGILPFADTANENGKGIFVWVRASNPSAGAVQDFCDADGLTMYEKLAEIVAEIANQGERIGSSGYSNVGMVVAGTSPEKTSALRKKFDKIWFLVPGYGSQGAGAAQCLRFCKPDGTGAIINASRSIIYAYQKPEYIKRFGQNWEKCIEQAVIDAKSDLTKAAQ